MTTDCTDDKAGQPVVAWLIRTGRRRKENDLAYPILFLVLVVAARKRNTVRSHLELVG